MKYIAAILLSLVQVCFTACKAEEQSSVMTEASASITENTEFSDVGHKESILAAPALISPTVKENFMLPLEDYSWERTEKAEYVMLHFTSAVVKHPENPYNLQYVREIFEETYISINYIIDRDGNIFCWLPESRAAWHAGKGTFGGDEKLTNSMNKYSIGIEMLAVGSQSDMEQYLTFDEYESLDDSLKGFTDKQYESLRLLVTDICTRNNIPFDREHIIGHDMYNPDKNDPGELFDWSRLFLN